MARLGTNLLMVATLPFLLAAASGKVIAVRGKVTLDNGQPVPDAEIIIKDSWAGFLSMRERELMRVTTDIEGNFFVKAVRYRHTLDLHILGKPCAWWGRHGTPLPDDHDGDGVYNVNIVLLRKECAGNPRKTE